MPNNFLLFNDLFETVSCGTMFFIVERNLLVVDHFLVRKNDLVLKDDLVRKDYVKIDFLCLRSIT